MELSTQNSKPSMGLLCKKCVGKSVCKLAIKNTLYFGSFSPPSLFPPCSHFLPSLSLLLSLPSLSSFLPLHFLSLFLPSPSLLIPPSHFHRLHTTGLPRAPALLTLNMVSQHHLSPINTPNTTPNPGRV